MVDPHKIRHSYPKPHRRVDLSGRADVLDCAMELTDLRPLPPAPAFADLSKEILANHSITVRDYLMLRHEDWDGRQIYVKSAVKHGYIRLRPLNPFARAR